VKTSKVVALRPSLQARGPKPRAVEASPALAEAVCAGLSANPKTLPAALLYDDLGSALFEAITLLPEYEVTRADLRLLDTRATDVAALLPTADVVELGPGAGRKAKLFLERFGAGRPLRFSAIDVSLAALRDCARTVEQLPNVSVSTVQGRYLDGLSDVVASRRPGVPLLVLFLGSNLSNFERAEAQAFLGEIRRLLGDGDALLLATDLDKPASQLIPAYDDAIGVTAAFNKNLLVRLNRELSANFDVSAFQHEARWSTVHRRIEMHLVASRALEVTLGATGDVFQFEHGESLWTESSHRFRTDELNGWGRAAGFVTEAQWVDSQWAFAHTLFRAGKGVTS
jgi:L-histidine Nalpha-methyltransferase